MPNSRLNTECFDEGWIKVNWTTGRHIDLPPVGLGLLDEVFVSHGHGERRMVG